jgi:hypothetical protein
MPKNPLWNELGWRGPHPGYLGGLVAEQPVMIREPNLVAYISEISAYPDGFTFTAYLQQATEDGPVQSNEPLVEVRFSDGRGWAEEPDKRHDFLLARYSESTRGPEGVSWRKQYWVPAMPPGGPVAFAMSIGPIDGSATFDGTALRDAASKAIDLWEPPLAGP